MTTLNDLRASAEATISAAEAASVLGMSPQWLRLMARESPGKLGFPVIVYGKRVKIPRLPFLHYLEGGRNNA